MKTSQNIPNVEDLTHLLIPARELVCKTPAAPKHTLLHTHTSTEPQLVPLPFPFFRDNSNKTSVILTQSYTSRGAGARQWINLVQKAVAFFKCNGLWCRRWAALQNSSEASETSFHLSAPTEDVDRILPHTSRRSWNYCSLNIFSLMHLFSSPASSNFWPTFRPSLRSNWVWII